MPSRHFGEYGVDTPSSAPNHGKPHYLKALPHARSRCGCWDCDKLRQENGMARAALNWNRDYPPKFYESIEVDYYGEEGAAEAAEVWAKELEDWD